MTEPAEGPSVQSKIRKAHMNIGRQIRDRRRRLRLSGEALVGSAAGMAATAAFSAGTGLQAAGLFALAAAALGCAGALVVAKAHSNAPDGALMAMRDKAAQAEAEAAEAEELRGEIEERAQCAGVVISQMAADLPPDAFEPSEIERAKRYLSDPTARQAKPFLPWPRDAADIATDGRRRT